MKLVIDREKWGRGQGVGSLLGDDGKMCCLGFLGLACGFKDDDIFGLNYPNEINAEPTRNKKVLATMIDDGDRSDLARNLGEINDNEETTDRQKESAIKKEFKKIGVEVVFKN